MSLGALVVLLSAACSRAGDAPSSAGEVPPVATTSESVATSTRPAPQLDGGGDDVLGGSPTADRDRTIFDALRRDRPSEVDAISLRPLSRAKLDSLRASLLDGSVTFRRAVATEDGLEIVYAALHGGHELHLVYETRGATRLADAWVFGW